MDTNLGRVIGYDGKQIELSRDSLYIKWRYVGDTTWKNLIALNDLKVGLPKGGKVDQILAKASNNDWDYVWKTQESGGSSVDTVTLLSVTTAPVAPFPVNSKYYNANENLIYRATEADTWEEADTTLPELGAFYLFDDEIYFYDKKTESLFQVKTIPSTIFYANKTIEAGESEINMEVDLSNALVITVCVNGNFQSYNKDYTITTNNGESTIHFDEAVEEDSNIDIVYSSYMELSGGGGTGGTTNYNDLSNKPKINNVELQGNKSAKILGLQEKINEFTVTPELFNSYKIEYLNSEEEKYDYLLDIFAMINGENIASGSIINLNDYPAVIDAIVLNDKTYTIKNGTIFFDNPNNNTGCGRALLLNHSNIYFNNCKINGPDCGADYLDGIIEVNNGNIEITNNSYININFRDTSSFIVLNNNALSYIKDTDIGLNINDDIDHSVVVNCVFVKGDDCRVYFKGCENVRFFDPDIEKRNILTFIKTDTNKNCNINLLNNVFYMFGDESYYHYLLDINLDNTDCYINNNTLQGLIKLRDESINTIYNRLQDNQGQSITFNEGEEIWDIFLYPEYGQNSDFDFGFVNKGQFFSKIDINPNDIRNAYKVYNFTWKNIDNEEGFILNYNPDETYQTSDLISTNQMTSEYGIEVYIEGSPQDGNILSVILFPSTTHFKIEEQFTISNENEFYDNVENGKASRIGPGQVNSFTNNSIDGAFTSQYQSFFTNSSEALVTKNLILNNKDIHDLQDIDGIFHPRNGDELNEIFENEPGYSKTIDFSNFDVSSFYSNGYTIDGKSFTLRNFSMGSNWGAWQFNWMKSPLFTLNNGAALYFQNLVINVEDVHHDPQGGSEASNTAPLIKAYDDSHISITNGGMININNVTGIDKYVAIELNNSNIYIQNFGITINSYDENRPDDTDSLTCAIECNGFSYAENNFDRVGFNISGNTTEKYGIKYNDDLGAYIKINGGGYDIDNGYSIFCPNTTILNLDFIDLGKITAIEPNIQQYDVNTEYEVGDIVERDGQIYRISKNENNEIVYNDFWTVNINGTMYSVEDPDEVVAEYDAFGNYRADGLILNTENWKLPISDEHLTSTNAQNAIKELAASGSSLLNQTGKNGKYLKSNGSTASWEDLELPQSALEEAATVAQTGDYNDLINKPTIPTVNDATISFTQGGVNKGSFTLNQSSGTTITLDAGGGDPLPSQTGQAGKFLTTDGTNASWATVQSGGGSTAVVDTVTKTLLAQTSSVNTEIDLSSSCILGVYINGLYQLATTDYSITTTSGESTITFVNTYNQNVTVTVVYATDTSLVSVDYTSLSNKPQINGVTLTGNVSLSSLGIQSQNLSYSNISASTWVADSTYSGYGYKCDITCNGVTSNSYAQVIFNPTEATSGNYATICSTSANTVTIYSKVNTTITIPTIIVMGA